MKRNITIIYFITTLFLISCSQQAAPPLNLEDEQQADQSTENLRANLPEPPEAVFASESVEEEPVENVEVNSGPMPEPVEPEESDPKDELKFAPILYEDYAWEKYMVEPGDFLVKIAKKEYGDFKLWKYIYEWNKEQIGDNPNIIYPYNFFDLQKERLAAKTAEPSFFDYTVQPGDNLWNIAGRQYGDAKSWIILLRDNEDSIKASAGILNPGMVLKLRDKLDPNS